jgi:hypothetical protein
MAVKATDLWRTPVNVTPAFWERTIRGAGGPAVLACVLWDVTRKDKT